MFSLDFRAHSETGLVRKNNQDSGYASPTALVIADGMGGAAAGDLASAVAIRQVAKADGRYPSADLITRLGDAMRSSNEVLTRLVAHDHSLDGMGTTFCGAFFSGDQLGIVHIGDSRGYLFRDGTLTRLTHDHSWVQSLVDEGKITEDEALVHPHRSLVLKVLNGQPNHEPDTFSLDVHEGDIVLFCSDGLCGFTTDDVIAASLDRDDLDEAMALLVRAAHDGGGADNITISMARIVPQDAALDAQHPLVIGAADELPEPDLPSEEPAAVAAPADLDDGSVHTPTAPAPHTGTAGTGSATGAAHALMVDEEIQRYSPTLERPRRWRGAVITLIALLVLGGLGYGGYRWSQTQYFVADNGGTVAVFRGVNVPVLPLSHLDQSTDIVTSELPRYHRERVQASFRVHNPDEVASALDQLRQVAGTCASPTPTPSVTATPAPTVTATPTASATSAGSPSGSTLTAPSDSLSSSGQPSSGQPSSVTPSSTPSSATPASSTTSPGSTTNGEC